MKNPILLLFLVPILLLSCSTEEAQKVADDYHDNLKSAKYDYILDNLVDSEQIEADGRDTWMGLMLLIESWGKIESIEKETGFNKSYDNGVTIVNLDYRFEFDPIGEVFERLALIDRDEGVGYKILGVRYNPDKDKLDEEDSS